MTRATLPALGILSVLVLAAPAGHAQPASVPAGSQPAASQPAGTATPATLGELLPSAVPVPHAVSSAPGFAGLWYPHNRPTPALGTRLSGGVAFCPMEATPVACYAPAVKRTFFVFAGTGEVPEKEPYRQRARMSIAVYDHQEGTVSRPTILVGDLPSGVYGCPAMAIDAAGRIWVFVSFLGVERPGLILRSSRAYDVTAWEKVMEMDFQQPQPWYVPGQGFLLVHTRTLAGQIRLCYAVSPDGLAWSRPVPLAAIGVGQTGISGRSGNKIGVALSYRDEDLPVWEHTSLYYLETTDLGKSWNVYPRGKATVPLEGTSNPALVCDFGKDWRFFLRDLQFDRAGRPVMLYILRHRRKALPAPESRIWSTSRWASREWETTGTLYSDQDYDAGCLLIERNLQYAVLPTDPGPRRNTAGGNLVRWRSEDQGRSWYPRPLTFDTDLNHNWVRHPQDGQPDFELIWADGNTRRPSESHLYCADAAGNVYLLPVTMSTDAAKPKRVWAAPAPASQPAATQSSAAGSAATSPAAVQVPASRPQ